jgi:PEP-CTERM motif-containing protein
MRLFLKLFAVAAFFVVSACIASADTIQLGSYGTGDASLGNANTAIDYAGYTAASTTPSAGVGTSYALAPGLLWATAVTGSTWVGFAPSAGPVGTSNPELGYYTFSTSFTEGSSSLYSGSLSIMADDTVEVFLNGVLVAPFAALGSDYHCADVVPDCLTVDTIVLSNLALLSGVDANTFTFVVQQAGLGPVGGTGDPTGLDFSALLSAVPEPNSLLMLATGMLGCVSAVRHRRRGTPPFSNRSSV